MENVYAKHMRELVNNLWAPCDCSILYALTSPRMMAYCAGVIAWLPVTMARALELKPRSRNACSMVRFPVKRSRDAQFRGRKFFLLRKDHQGGLPPCTAICTSFQQLVQNLRRWQRGHDYWVEQGIVARRSISLLSVSVQNGAIEECRPSSPCSVKKGGFIWDKTEPTASGWIGTIMSPNASRSPKQVRRYRLESSCWWLIGIPSGSAPSSSSREIFWERFFSIARSRDVTHLYPSKSGLCTFCNFVESLRPAAAMSLRVVHLHQRRLEVGERRTVMYWMKELVWKVHRFLDLALRHVAASLRTGVAWWDANPIVWPTERCCT